MGPALTEHPDRVHRDLSSLRGGSLPDLLPPDRRPADPGLVPGSLGMTETLGPHHIDYEGVELGEDKRGSYGRSVPGIEHQIVDPETGRPLAVGEPGELCVRGESVMLGLYKRERSEVFTADGWYRTGDGGWLDADGHFFFTGRLGQMIKSGGRNVAPAQVEQVLEEQKEVRRAIVVGVPSASRGEDVAAAVVVEPGAVVTAEELQERLRAELAPYEVPRHIAVLSDDAELPWLDSGKVDRRTLATTLAGRVTPGE
jgi:acyl-CoA synthetase (AMP-forming)/AMP-acid ligase II